MTRPKSLFVQERDEQIANTVKELLAENKMVDVSALAARFNCGTSAVKKACSDNGVLLPKSKPGPKVRALSEAISRLHAQIGRDLGEFQFFKAGGNTSYMTSKLLVPPAIYGNMVAGLHNFTLTELQRIADLLEKPIEDLTKLRSVGNAGSVQPADAAQSVASQ